MSADRVEICVVGAGPRGLSVLERLCANERKSPRGSLLVVHVVDPAEPGPGAVWRPDQSRHLLMNTVASQITVHTDDSVTMDGPAEPGPSLYEWARTLSADSSGEYDDRALAEAAGLGPDAYPTRAFYGLYLRDAFRAVVERAPAHLTVTVHRSRAVAIGDTPGSPHRTQDILLENGVRLVRLHAVVLAQGHVPVRPTQSERSSASLARAHRLSYLPPANPADVDLSSVRPGRPTLIRGLGLAFFDHMALLTSGRGGTFERQDDRLVYHPSGREPLLYATSRRGIPYHARGENEKGAHGRYVPRLLTTDVISGLRERGRGGERVSFGMDLWPLVSKEVRSVYYAALLARRSREADRELFTKRFLRAGDEEEPALLDAFGIEPDARWDWERVARPYPPQALTDRTHFRRWLLSYLRQDVAEARAGNVSSPLKAGLDVLRDLRNEIRLAVDHGGVDGDSYRDELDGWYTPLNAFLSIGPPISRIEEMIALIEAGVLDVIGPDPRIQVDTDDHAFTAESQAVAGPLVRVAVLIEARLPVPDLQRTADPLLRHMLDTGQCAPYRIAGAYGTDYETGGLAVTERPYHVLDAAGAPHPRRFAYGVPTEWVHWVTAAGIRPGVDSVTLGDSDCIARAVLALPTAGPPAHLGRAADATEPTEVTA